MIKVTRTDSAYRWDVQKDDGHVSSFANLFLAFGDGVRDRIRRDGEDTVMVEDRFSLDQR
jgi:hypothetical protein